MKNEKLSEIDTNVVNYNDITVKYYNYENLSYYDAPPPNFDYGIEHFRSDGHLVSGMEMFEYSSADSLPNTNKKYKRSKYLDEIGATLPNDEFLKKVGSRRDWRKPTNREFMTCYFLVRKFMKSTRTDKKLILWNLLDFDDTGLAFGSSEYEADVNFSYKFTCEPSIYSVYLPTDEMGFPTEISLYKKPENIKVRNPLDIVSILLMVSTIIADMHKVDFEKFNESDLTDQEKQLKTLCFDLNVNLPIDDMDVGIFVPIYLDVN